MSSYDHRKLKDMEEITIVGAGPYGLSIAAHLGGAGIAHRIFGRPMTTWREHMPVGMFLKSEGYASSLCAPGKRGTGTFGEYCRSSGIPYQDVDLPVPLDRFVDYAIAFQKRFVAQLEEIDVAFVEHVDNGFDVELTNGDRVRTRHLIMATGITWFSNTPIVFRNIPDSFVSHSSCHRTATQFAGKNVVVIGVGASAADTAILLADSGANVRIVARSNRIRFHRRPPTGGRTVLQKLRHPQTVIGPGWRSKFFCDWPLLFHRLPASLRAEIVQTHLGPAPGWVAMEGIESRIPVLLGKEVYRVRAHDAGIELQLLADDGSHSQIAADHVVLATGYTVDLRQIPLLSHALRGSIKHHRHSPLLSNNFETSVPNLYFVGPAAAHAFGPLMRFMVGAGWLAPRLSRHLGQKLQHAYLRSPPAGVLCNQDERLCSARPTHKRRA